MNSPSTGKWIADSTSNDNRKLRLSDLRRKRGITRQKLALDLNMTQNSVSRYESETPSSCGAAKRDAGAWLTGKPRQAARNAPGRLCGFFSLYNNSSFLYITIPRQKYRQPGQRKRCLFWFFSGRWKRAPPFVPCS